MTGSGGRRRVTIVSPHFDDVPLSLGQSLRDGVFSKDRVHVRVAFGHTNWTSWVHPTPARARWVGLWRRAEETAASVVFGYRWTAAGWDEVILRHALAQEDRTGDWELLGPESILDPSSDLTGEPLVHDVAGWLRAIASGPGAMGPPDGSAPDLLLVCAGLGGHVDHRIVARAAASLVGSVETSIGFYEDRPYVSHLSVSERDQQLADLGLDLTPIEVSDPVSRSTQMRARRCYPSQMAPFFEEAMDLDRVVDARERVWFPDGRVPEWLRARTTAV